MLEGYKTITAEPGECFDVQGVYENMQLIASNAGTTSNQVFCTRVDENIAFFGKVGTTEQIVEISNRENDIESNQIDDKLFILNINSSVSFSGGEDNFSVSVKFIVKCGTEVIYSGYETGVIVFNAKCPRFDPIVFCVEHRVNYSGNESIPYGISGNYYACGSILCTGQKVNTLQASSYFEPGNFDPDCCHGRETLQMLAQNADALSNAFTRIDDQIVQSFNVNAETRETITLANNSTGNSEFLIFGEITVCVRNRSSSQIGTVHIKPKIGCGDDEFHCLPSEFRVSRANQGDGDGDLTCYRIPVILCGSCAQGVDLVAGLSSEIDCDDEVVRLESGPYVTIESVRQSYCVWLFPTNDQTLLSGDADFKLNRCLKDTPLKSLIDKYDRLSAYAEARKPVETFYREITGEAGRGECVVLPLDMDFSRVYVVGKITVSATLQNSEKFRMFANADFKCDGETVLSSSSRWGGQAPPRISVITLEFSGCIDCERGSEYSICFDGSTIFGVGGPPSRFEYALKFFSFQ